MASHSAEEPVRSEHGFILMCTNLHPNLTEADLLNAIIDRMTVQQPPHIKLPLNHRTGLGAGYALIAVQAKDDAMRLQRTLDGSMLFGQRLQVAFAFAAVQALRRSDAN